MDAFVFEEDGEEDLGLVDLYDQLPEDLKATIGSVLFIARNLAKLGLLVAALACCAWAFALLVGWVVLFWLQTQLLLQLSALLRICYKLPKSSDGHGGVGAHDTEKPYKPGKAPEDASNGVDGGKTLPSFLTSEEFDLFEAFLNSPRDPWEQSSPLLEKSGSDKPDQQQNSIYDNPNLDTSKITGGSEETISEGGSKADQDYVQQTELLPTLDESADSFEEEIEANSRAKPVALSRQDHNPSNVIDVALSSQPIDRLVDTGVDCTTQKKIERLAKITRVQAKDEALPPTTLKKTEKMETRVENIAKLKSELSLEDVQLTKRMGAQEASRLARNREARTIAKQSEDAEKRAAEQTAWLERLNAGTLDRPSNQSRSQQPVKRFSAGNHSKSMAAATTLSTTRAASTHFTPEQLEEAASFAAEATRGQSKGTKGRAQVSHPRNQHKSVRHGHPQLKESPEHPIPAWTHKADAKADAKGDGETSRSTTLRSKIVPPHMRKKVPATGILPEDGEQNIEKDTYIPQDSYQRMTASSGPALHVDKTTEHTEDIESEDSQSQQYCNEDLLQSIGYDANDSAIPSEDALADTSRNYDKAPNPIQPAEGHFPQAPLGSLSKPLSINDLMTRGRSECSQQLSAVVGKDNQSTAVRNRQFEPTPPVTKPAARAMSIQVLKSFNTSSDPSTLANIAPTQRRFIFEDDPATFEDGMSTDGSQGTPVAAVVKEQEPRSLNSTTEREVTIQQAVDVLSAQAHEKRASQSTLHGSINNSPKPTELVENDIGEKEKAESFNDAIKASSSYQHPDLLNIDFDTSESVIPSPPAHRPRPSPSLNAKAPAFFAPSKGTGDQNALPNEHGEGQQLLSSMKSGDMSSSPYSASTFTTSAGPLWTPNFTNPLTHSAPTYRSYSQQYVAEPYGLACENVTFCSPLHHQQIKQGGAFEVVSNLNQPTISIRNPELAKSWPMSSIPTERTMKRLSSKAVPIKAPTEMHTDSKERYERAFPVFHEPTNSSTSTQKSAPPGLMKADGVSQETFDHILHGSADDLPNRPFKTTQDTANVNKIVHGGKLWTEKDFVRDLVARASTLDELKAFSQDFKLPSIAGHQFHATEEITGTDTTSSSSSKKLINTDIDTNETVKAARQNEEICNEPLEKHVDLNSTEHESSGTVKKKRRKARGALKDAWREREEIRKRVVSAWTLDGARSLEYATETYNSKRSNLAKTMGSNELSEQDAKTFPVLSKVDLSAPKIRPGGLHGASKEHKSVKSTKLTQRSNEPENKAPTMMTDAMLEELAKTAIEARKSYEEAYNYFSRPPPQGRAQIRDLRAQGEKRIELAAKRYKKKVEAVEAAYPNGMPAWLTRELWTFDDGASKEGRDRVIGWH